MNASIEWFSLAIPACVRLSDLSAMKKWNCLSTLALSFLMKYIRFPLIFHPHNWTCRICVWSCYWAGICRINENRSETVIIASFGAEPSSWFERWLSKLLFYLAESWVTRKSWLTLNSTHLKGNLFGCEVDVKHQKRLDLFWNLIENFSHHS